MPKLIVANWKMNPQSEQEAIRLARASDAKNVVICPPFPFLPAVKKVLKRAALGAQDVFWKPHGAYTGEVSPLMLKNSNVAYVIVGHSERRKYLNETDEMVNKKLLAVVSLGLTAILCVGDDMSIRRKGSRAVEAYIRNQITKALRGVPRREYPHIVFTYEPSWAISTSHSVKSRDNADKPEDAMKMIRFMRNLLAARYLIKNSCVIYGGSVNQQNAKAFLLYTEIDGALVGGASLNAGEFKKIIKIASQKA